MYIDNSTTCTFTIDGAEQHSLNIISWSFPDPVMPSSSAIQSGLCFQMTCTLDDSYPAVKLLYEMSVIIPNGTLTFKFSSGEHNQYTFATFSDLVIKEMLIKNEGEQQTLVLTVTFKSIYAGYQKEFQEISTSFAS